MKAGYSAAWNPKFSAFETVSSRCSAQGLWFGHERTPYVRRGLVISSYLAFWKPTQHASSATCRPKVSPSLCSFAIVPFSAFAMWRSKLPIPHSHCPSAPIDRHPRARALGALPEHNCICIGICCAASDQIRSSAYWSCTRAPRSCRHKSGVTCSRCCAKQTSCQHAQVPAPPACHRACEDNSRAGAEELVSHAATVCRGYPGCCAGLHCQICRADQLDDAFAAFVSV
jgi:hypothetical protein